MIGQTLDRYMVESKLGEGGMGVVYRARDTQLDRLVAIKVLPHERVADPERKHRFAQEAKAASALNHPGIVTIYDISSDAGIDFMVMEYVRGRTLDSIIPSKRIGITQALRYAAQMADALAAAHDAGIIHRDLKPSNVVVTDDDRVKILDFGLAKLLEPAGGSEDRTRAAPLTEAGLVVGTVAYMSPEQAEGRRVDGRSDIFSFGSMLYEMVTGRRPFAGESSLSTLARIVNDDPTAPSQIVPAVSSDVERAILRCLRKDPARRFQTMADLKVALEDLAADSADPRAPHVAAPGRDRRWRRWTWTAVIPIALAAAYGSWYAMRTRDSSAPLRALPLTSLPGVVRNPSLAPDGNHVAFTWSGAQKDNPDVYVQQIGAGSPLRLTTDPANDYSPVWSPDGQSIAFLRQGSDPRHSELRLVPPLGGSERKLADIRPNAAFLRPVTLGWCPDSSCIAVTDAQNGSISDAIVVVAVDTGQKRQLTFPPANVLADTDPVISPDGRWLAFRRDIAPFTGQLQLQRLGAGVTATGDPQPLTTITMQAYGPGWMPDSREMVFSAKGALWRVGIAAGSAPQRLPFVGEDGVMPVVSRGTPGTPLRLVYVRSFADSNIWRVGTDGPGTAATAPPAVAISSTRSDGIPSLSPDGQRLVFTSDRSGELEMWLADIGGGHPVQLTTMGLIPGFGRWSPDGGTIVFHSNPENHGDVLAVAADGGKPRNLTPGPRNGTFPSFSRDGRWIYFSAFRDGTIALWKIPASGGEPVRVSTAPGSLAIESTDGANLYYVNSRTTDRPGTLVQQSLASGAVVNLIDNVVSTSFDVIAQGIFYIERLGGESQLKFYAFSTRKSMVVASNLGQLFFGLTASRDGRSIFYSRIDSSVDDLMLVENFR